MFKVPNELLKFDSKSNNIAVAKAEQKLFLQKIGHREFALDKDKWHRRYVDEYISHLGADDIYDYFVKNFADDKDVPMYVIDGVAHRDTENYEWFTDHDMVFRRYIISWRKRKQQYATVNAKVSKIDTTHLTPGETLCLGDDGAVISAAVNIGDETKEYVESIQDAYAKTKQHSQQFD